MIDSDDQRRERMRDAIIFLVCAVAIDLVGLLFFWNRWPGDSVCCFCGVCLCFSRLSALGDSPIGLAMGPMNVPTVARLFTVNHVRIAMSICQRK